MKKLFLSLILSVLWSSTLFSDIIPEGSYWVRRQVQITNINAFPDIMLIGYITHIMDDSHEVYVIQENVPLSKGYKHNAFQVFAIKKSVVEQAGGVGEIDFETIARKTPPTEILDPDGYFVIDNHLRLPESDDCYYQIIAVTEKGLTLKLYKRVLKPRDGGAAIVITY